MTNYLDVIIAGGGRVGFQTAKLLAAWDHDITVIERDSATVDAIADEYLATVIDGNASNPEILEQAGVGEADVIAGLTGESGLNLAVCMEATAIAPEIRTVARIDSAEKEAYTRFVDTVLFPERAGARTAANKILGGDVLTLSEVTGDLDIMLIRVEEGAPAAGKTLETVQFPAGTLVVSDDEGNHIARPDTTLTSGNRYVVAVEPGVANEVMNLLRGT